MQIHTQLSDSHWTPGGHSKATIKTADASAHEHSMQGATSNLSQGWWRVGEALSMPGERSHTGAHLR
jgi:hypothetical protein